MKTRISAPYMIVSASLILLAFLLVSGLIVPATTAQLDPTAIASRTQRAETRQVALTQSRQTQRAIVDRAAETRAVRSTAIRETGQAISTRSVATRADFGTRVAATSQAFFTQNAVTRSVYGTQVLSTREANATRAAATISAITTGSANRRAQRSTTATAVYLAMRDDVGFVGSRLDSLLARFGIDSEMTYNAETDRLHITLETNELVMNENLAIALEADGVTDARATIAIMPTGIRYDFSDVVTDDTIALTFTPQVSDGRLRLLLTEASYNGQILNAANDLPEDFIASAREDIQRAMLQRLSTLDAAYRVAFDTITLAEDALAVRFTIQLETRNP